MKNNTQLVKLNLEKALNNIPNDFCLLEAKNHIKIALNKINEVEKKREKRNNLKNKREELKLKKDSIYIIEKLIESEKEKLEKSDPETFLE